MSFGCLEYSGRATTVFCYILFGYHSMAGVNSLLLLFPVVPFISYAHKGFSRCLGVYLKHL